MDVTLQAGLELENVVVIGSRNPNRTATESTVPVDVIDIKELNNVAPQVNLNYVAPSFTSNTQTISDGTDHIDPASLRGLGPDQDGYDLANILDDDVSDVIQYANQANINLNGAATKEELQPILSADNTEAELAA